MSRRCVRCSPPRPRTPDRPGDRFCVKQYEGKRGEYRSNPDQPDWYSNFVGSRGKPSGRAWSKDSRDRWLYRDRAEAEKLAHGEGNPHGWDRVVVRVRPRDGRKWSRHAEEKIARLELQREHRKVSGDLAVAVNLLDDLVAEQRRLSDALALVPSVGAAVNDKELRRRVDAARGWLERRKAAQP